jgi:DNA polymerase-3 subunit gamma/tau
VSFRNIPAMEPARKPATRKSDGADGAAGGALATRRESDGEARQGSDANGARLLIETGVEMVTEAEKPAATGAGSGSLGSLSRIRQQFASRAQSDEAASSQPLEPEALHRAWQQYADYLRENRNPAVQSLELAELRIVDHQTFEVVTGNNLEQKFIEQEKRNLSDHLQKVFVNKALSFSVTIGEKAADVEETADRPMNKREQFQQIVDQYPLVKELKDRLRLELDY